MPTYKYNCIDCNTTYERMKPMKNSGTDKCGCGGLATKVMTGFNIGGSKSGKNKEKYVLCPECAEGYSCYFSSY